jgi:(R)-amidase
MRIELAQLSCQDGCLEENLAQALDAIERTTPDTDLLVFPETYLSGFPTPENVARVSQPLNGAAMNTLTSAIRARGLSLVIGFSESQGERYFNTTVVLTPEGLALSYRKMHLWLSDRGVFSAGERIDSCLWRGLRLGALICYDIEFPETARALGVQGTELLIVTDGNMQPFGPVHRRAIAARAMENQMFAVLVNRCGTGAGYDFAGESVVIDPFGEVVAECGVGAEQRVVDIDLGALASARAQYDYLRERRIALDGTIGEAGPGVRSFNGNLRSVEYPMQTPDD